jgi:hypothetical protein
MLLQISQLLSSGGSQVTAIAYPLLVLSITGSPARAGIVAFARLLGMTLFGLPAGLAADHWSRRSLMLGAHAARAFTIGSLGALVILDEIVFWLIPLVAFIEGSGAAVYSAAQAGALRAVVPKWQLPAAVSVVTGREAAISVAAPPVGGALFGLLRALPFIVHAVSYAISTVALLAMRTPFQEDRAIDRSPLRRRLAEGFRFLWEHRFLRTCAFLYAPTNFIGPGLLFALVVLGKEQGLLSAEVGVLVGVFGACVLIGSLLSPLVRRALPVRAVLLLELWTWPGCAAFLVWPNVYVLTASLIPTALAIPSTDSVVRGYQLAMTPDKILGRVESVRSTISLSIAPFGPLVAGFLLATASERATIAVFAGLGLALAVWGTLSPSIRAAPSLHELTELPAPETLPTVAG